MQSYWRKQSFTISFVIIDSLRSFCIFKCKHSSWPQSHHYWAKQPCPRQSHRTSA